MYYSRIIGSGSSLPERRLTNFDLEKMVDTSDAWIMERTGISSRHIVTDESSADLASEAAKEAIVNADIDPKLIDLIIVATCTPERLLPNTGCLVQNALGIRGCPAFDLNAACSGFIYALSVADQYISRGLYKHILTVGTDTLSKIVNWEDRTTCVLFGDGAGAIVLRADHTPGILGTHLYSDAANRDVLYATKTHADTSPIIKMRGRELFKVAVNTLEKLAIDTLDKHGFKHDDLDWLVPHQANLRIIKAAAKRLKLPLDRVIQTVQKHGNTSAASLPLALHDGIQSGKVKQNELVMLEVFGAGLTWGSALLRY